MTTGLSRNRVCGTMQVHYRLLTTDLDYARNRQTIENRAREYASRNRSPARTEITVIPTVVHVIFNSSSPAQNISQAQIESQITTLNQDFRKTNPDSSLIPAPFKALAADTQIEFALASTDPQGNSTNGITRTSTDITSFDPNDQMKSSASGGMDAWPTDRYLNIWVCQLRGGLLGYAQFPGGPAKTDGVVVTHTAFGNTGTAAAPFNQGRTTTHEVGHWLNLRHIWGDDGNGCSGSDFVDDTPNQSGPNTGMPDFPRITCNNTPHGDMFMNYMDYTDDAGMFMFTTGQALRMQAVLDNERASLGSPPPSPPVQTTSGNISTTDGDGNVELLKSYDTLKGDWSVVIPGKFSDSNYTDLLFYNSSTGEAEMYSTNGQGELDLLKQHSLAKSWSIIVPGQFSDSSYTDLLFYNAATGAAEIHNSDGNGNLSLFKSFSDWTQNWKAIVPGNFGGNRYSDLLFYNDTSDE